jgi:hypothetical protein
MYGHWNILRCPPLSVDVALCQKMFCIWIANCGIDSLKTETYRVLSTGVSSYHLSTRSRLVRSSCGTECIDIEELCFLFFFWLTQISITFTSTTSSNTPGWKYVLPTSCLKSILLFQVTCWLLSLHHKHFLCRVVSSFFSSLAHRSRSVISLHLVRSGCISASQLRLGSRIQPWKFATKSPSL